MATSIQGIFLAGALLFASSLAMPQDDQTPHKSSPGLVEVGGTDMAAVIHEVARATGRPIGWVISSNDQKPCLVARMKVLKADPTGALEAITAQCPDYILVQDQLGAVFEPVQPMKNILELPIRDFSVRDVTSFAAEYAVQHLPEVEQWLKVNHLKPFDVEPGDKWRGDTARVSIHLHDVPLREVLNEISLKSKRMVWKIVWFDRDTSLGIFL